jgi:BirA family biotin operon repressor/biotin-[acetyl-CoA-carboxylase] ligase
MLGSELSGPQIQSALSTTCIGRAVSYWPSIGSTMDEARQLAEGGAAEGTVVVADVQTAGRGRLQRAWWAPAGSSLLLTIVLRPDLEPRRAQRLTMACSLAVCDAIAQVCGLEGQIKWPNDVLICGRKVCGILTELELVGMRLAYALVGIGLNANVDLSVAPPLMVPATSLLTEAGHPVSRLDLLVALLTSIERRYIDLCRGVPIHVEWADRMATLGQHVQANGGSESWIGVASGVDEDGALLLLLDDGTTRRLLAGDVTLRAHLNGGEEA